MNNKSSEHCIFCKILKGELEASIVYEDAQVVAFMDIEPVNEGHAKISCASFIRFG